MAISRKDAIEILSAVLLLGFLTIGFPAFLLWGAGAAQEEANLISFFFYGILAIPTVMFIFARIYLDNRNFFENHPEFQAFDYITLHSPEQTWLGQRFENLTSASNLFSIFFIISLILGAGISISGQFASGVPTLTEASVSGGTQLGLAVEPAVSSETLFFNVLLLMGQTAALYYILYRRGLSPGQAVFISKFVAVLLTTVQFYLYHSFRYGAAETNQIGVLLLGFLLNLVTAATHSVIPAYLIHGANNFFHKATVEGIFTSELTIIFVVLGTLFAGVALWFNLFQQLR